MSDFDDFIRGIVELTHHYAKQHGYKSLVRPGCILVFIDDDNYIEVKPQHVCIPCEHDPVRQQEMRMEQEKSGSTVVLVCHTDNCRYNDVVSHLCKLPYNVIMEHKCKSYGLLKPGVSR